MSTETTLERRCRRLFSRLNSLVNKLKRHDNETVHFNIENALQYVEAQNIQAKFAERAVAKGRDDGGGEQREEAEKALRACVSHLDSCIETCKRLGTPQWASGTDDSALSVAWSLFVANFNSASHLLGLAELDLHPFLGLRSQSSAKPSRFDLTRRDSTLSASSSRAETIEFWQDLRGRQEQGRLAALQAGRLGVMGMTATGTAQPTKLPLRRPASIISTSTSASSISTASTATAHPSTPPTPASIRPELLVPTSKVSEGLLFDCIPARPPPPYSPSKPPLVRVLDDKAELAKLDDDWDDTKTVVSTGSYQHYNKPPEQAVRRAASDSVLGASAHGSTSHFHLHGSGNTLNVYTAAPQPQHWPGAFYSQAPPPMMMPGPISGQPFQLPLPPPPRPVSLGPLAYKPSRTSLRETAALHLFRQGAPSLTLHALKPEATCEHGVVHFKQHAYCGWGNCCNQRGCGGTG